MDRWMGMWVDGERGILFHMTLCRWGQPLTPTLCFSSPDELCLWLDWQFLPLLGILAFLLIMQAPPIPLPAAVSCSLSVSIFAQAHSFAWALSFAHLPTLAWHVNTSPSLMPSRFLRPFLKWLPSLQAEQRCAVRTKLKRTQTNIRYAARRWNVRNTCKKRKNFANTSEIHSKPSCSHTHIIFFSLPIWHMKIVLTSRTTRFSAPLGFYVSMATTEGSSCYYHQSLTSHPSAFTLSALIDSTFFLFWLTQKKRMCLSLCVCLF